MSSTGHYFVRLICRRSGSQHRASNGEQMPKDGTTVALFIDGANLHATAKALGFEIDYKRLLNEVQSRGTLARAFYYTAIIEDQEFSALRPLLAWLHYNAYTA